MTPPSLNEREFELINIIGMQLGSNQRDLSNHLNLSLGQTNMLIRRLISKGFIRISQLNKRKVQYLLTPKGLAEKFQKSVKYTVHTINAIGIIKSRLKEILARMYTKGERTFYITGESDLSTIVEMVLHDNDFPGVKIERINDLSSFNGQGIALYCSEVAIQGGERVVNLVQELAQQDIASVAKKTGDPSK